ncbi:DUF4266 domain-containing protein [Dyadobacter psychrotolerans]|uniref:DUF4266 domain-containing protein n=1 Tax=Dyadobacter psychrotolerans TaxID=2541721 RepID=A0A4R5DNP8_9BACT|nr:DUF4266 domain-containing protein [Dyadobacter psychrotolerans]TDE12535.1 DUF4266 domain-containing protein [Dyadobacter psychrotolerans]
MQKNRFLFLIFLAVLFSHSACQTVKPYQRIYLNDPEMQLGSNTGKKFEGYVESIREGATEAGGTKSSGGCGCN